MKHYSAFLKRAAGKGVLQKFIDYFNPPLIKTSKKKDSKGKSKHSGKK
jgi:hypothetical protein